MPIQINKIERALMNDSNNLNIRHQQQDFEMIWIRQGTGIHIINDENYQLTENVIYAALPGQQHELYLHPDTKGYIISFNSSRFNQLADDYVMSDESYLYQYFSRMPMISLDDVLSRQMADLISLLEEESYNCFVLKSEIICKYFHILQLYLRRHIERTSSTISTEKNSILLNSFLLLLENNFKQKRSVFDYAKELHVSPNYLNYVIKKATGHSASHHIQQRIVQEAKRKAKHSGSSMKEVAYDLGFSDLAHFSRFFKSMSGMNFTDFKRLAM